MLITYRSISKTAESLRQDQGLKIPVSSCLETKTVVSRTACNSEGGIQLVMCFVFQIVCLVCSWLSSTSTNLRTGWRPARCRRRPERGRTRLWWATRPAACRRRTTTTTDRSETGTTWPWRRVARRVARGRARRPRRWTGCGARTTSSNSALSSWRQSWGRSRTFCCRAPLAAASPRTINHRWHHRHRNLFAPMLKPSALTTSTHPTADPRLEASVSTSWGIGWTRFLTACPCQQNIGGLKRTI